MGTAGETENIVPTISISECENSSFFSKIPVSIQTFVAVMILFILVLVASRSMGDSSPTYEKHVIESITKIVKDSKDAHTLTKKLKYTDPPLAYEKVIFALGNIAAAKRMMPVSEIERLTSVNIQKLEQILEQEKEELTSAVFDMEE